MNLKSDNILVFHDTLNFIDRNSFLADSVINTIKDEEIIYSTSLIKARHNRYDKPFALEINKRRSFESASQYRDKKVCVLNFASFTNPGGGVLKGSNAQEESLCRISTLYPTLNTEYNYNNFYYPHRLIDSPFYNSDAIYSPSVSVFKSDTIFPSLLETNKWFNCDVLTLAAPNLRGINYSREEYLRVIDSRIRRMLDIMSSKGVEVCILGAFGCGAFSNSPDVVASTFFSALKDYERDFLSVVFSIFCPKDDEYNYQAFIEARDKYYF